MAEMQFLLSAVAWGEIGGRTSNCVRSIWWHLSCRAHLADGWALWNRKIVLIVLRFCWNKNITGSAFALSTCVLFSLYFVYLENAMLCKLLV